MDADDYQKIKEIFQSALEAPADKRQELLNERCGSDPGVRAEVERLLDSYESGFLENPAATAFAENGLHAGETLGHYTIVSKIGSGGMGEVYLAEDGKLGRLVAIKLLPEVFTEDEDRLRRFEQEARTASALNHPNILTVHEIGETGQTRYIATEYIDGETLRARLNRGPLSISEALDIAVQCASALAAAHENGIIHRDIKPENIMVRRDNLVKVLDFGLAKLSISRGSPPAGGGVAAASADGVGGHDAPTERHVRTAPGVIMGTVQYMSPEQTRGHATDARTDIWSLGVVLYEMAAGTPPFAGDNSADLIAEIVKTNPIPLSQTADDIPERLDEIVAKALEKNPDERYQAAKEFLDDLKLLEKSLDLGSGTESQAAHVVSNPRKFGSLYTAGANIDKKTLEDVSSVQYIFAGIKLHKRTALAILVLLIGLFGTTAFIARNYWRTPSGTNQANSFSDLRAVRLVSWKSGSGSPYTDYRASNNGKMIAYSSTQDGHNEGIYVKQTSDGDEMRVTKDEWNSRSPIWSPDDQNIAFVSRRDDLTGIYVIPLFGSRGEMLKVVGDGNVYLRHWSKDAAAIFYEVNGNLYKLDLATRETAKITEFVDSPDFDKYFSLSPDEQTIAYCDRFGGQDDLWIMPFRGGAAKRLTDDLSEEMRPRWHPDGKRIFYNVYRGDLTHIELVNTNGGPAEQITRGEGKYELIDVSADGTKIFYLTWEKRSDIFGVNIESGEEFDVAAGVESEFWADVAPDGQSFVHQVNGAPHLTTYLHESVFVVKNFADRAQIASFKGYNPQWLPDSRRIAFIRWTHEDQRYHLFLADTSTGEETSVRTDGVSPPSTSMLPINRGDIGEFHASPDGTRINYLDSKKQNVREVSIESGETIDLTNNQDPKVRYFSPIWSPDGKRIVTVSTQPSSDQSQPPVSRVWLIENGRPAEIFSTKEGLRLLGWSQSGNEIYIEATVWPMTAAPSDVRLLNLSPGGGHRIIGTFKGIYAKSMTLSGDGGTVAFVGRQNERDDIFTAPLDGGEPIKKTANGSSRLFFGSPAWSPDGRTIFFDKQEAINTISMFSDFK